MQPAERPIFVRIPRDKHFRLRRYATDHGFSLREVVENLVDQLLVQVDPGFPRPTWLAELRAGAVSVNAEEATAAAEKE